MNAISKRPLVARALSPWRLALLLALALVLHLATTRPSEPFYNGDEPRHVMTGVFFRDFILDMRWSHPIRYATDYYLQYPALGLAIYPPLFHLIEGAAMTLLGTSISIGKGLVLLFTLLAATYLYFLARRTHGEWPASLATAFFLASPSVFTLSHYVMLEMPTVAWSLMFLFHWDAYLGLGRRRDLALAAAAAAAAGLTRYSAVFLLPTAILMATLERRRWKQFVARDTWIAAVAALVLVLPYYVVAARWAGGIHLRQAVAALGGGGPQAPWPGSLFDYPAWIPAQLGWPLTIAAAVGVGLWLARRDHSGDPYAAVIIGTYVSATPLAMRDPRFVVYWVPAFALFGAAAVAAIRSSERLRVALAAMVFIATAILALRAPRPYLLGYADAARHVVSETRGSWYAFFDGTLNGNFIYQMRRADPERRLHVLRGDRLLYSVSIVPTIGYTEYFASADSMLAQLHRYDPDWVVIEEPPIAFQTPAGGRLRAALRADQRYRLEAQFPITSDLPQAKAGKLLLYRSIVRNPTPERQLQLRLPMLGRDLK